MRGYFLAFLVMACTICGCAGVKGGFGPGMTGVDRVSTACVSSGPTPGTCTLGTYTTGDTTYGIQLGLRAGAVAGSAGDDSGTGFAWDAHADFVVARALWGVGISAGYGMQFISGTENGGDLAYRGAPFAAYGQFALIPRIFVHGGAAYVAYGSVSRSLPDESSGDASAFRPFGGITFVFKRGRKRDFALRLEAQLTRSSSVMLAGRDATWTSAALMAEIIAADF